MLRTLAILLTLVTVATLSAHAQNGTRPGALSLIEAGLAADGTTPRYHIEANGADIRDVIASLLRKTGKEYVINQDVTGPVSFVLRDKTLDQILQTLQSIAKPAIAVAFGDVVKVSIAPPPQSQLGTTNTGVRPPAGIRTDNGQRPGRTETIRITNPAVLQNQAALFNQPVTLAIPDDKPVPLKIALGQISTQTQVPIRLDPRIPSDVGLAARFTETPLALVLDTIGRTGALKWQIQADGSILIGPSDYLLVTVRGVPAWGQPAGTCPTCRRPVLQSWGFCPHDGTPLTRQNRQSPPRTPR